MKAKTIFSLLFLGLLALSTSAQHIQFEEVKIPPYVDFDRVSYSSSAFADVDGDQDQDVLIIGSGYATVIAKLYTNDGNGNYSVVIDTPFVGVGDGDVAFADVDGDQDQDVLITGRNDGYELISQLYLNDGNGSFIEANGTLFEGVYISAVAFADVDGDQDLDVLISGRSSQSSETAKLYTNDGSGIFSEVVGTPFEGVIAGEMDFADVDGDQDLDVLLTGYNGYDVIAKLYLNDGNGTFAEETGTPFIGVWFGEVAFADVDGDQDQDVAIIGSDQYDNGSAKLYLNDGSGGFTEVMSTPFEGGFHGNVAFADMDGDQDQDILISGADEYYANVISAKLYLNDGNGAFTELLGTPFEGGNRGSLSIADVDGDQDLDVLLTGRNDHSSKSAALYFNEGNGIFSQISEQPFRGVGRSAVAFADIDGDQDQDVLMTGWTNQDTVVASLYTNDGNGNFLVASNTPFEGVIKGEIAFADIDADQDMDVLVIGQTDPYGLLAKLYTNDGNGVFSEVAGTPFEGVIDGAMAFADVDGDQDQDVLISGWNGSDRISSLYLNDGLGNFALQTGTPFPEVNRSGVAFADVDGDQDMDVLMFGSPDGMSSNHLTKLFLNDGSGNFSEQSGTPFEGMADGSVAFADVDGDQDQDVLITSGNTSGQMPTLFTNDGYGVFFKVIGTPFEGGHSFAFADVDGDLDQDVMIVGTNTGSSANAIAKLYANDGSGNFTEVVGMPFAAAAYGDLAFSDIDGDQDPDLMITGFGSAGATAKLYRNTSAEIDGVEEAIATAVILGQIFPNPAQTLTTIPFTLTKSAHVDLSILDLHGRKITQILLEHVPAGEHKISLDVSHLSAGIYLYRLLADNYTHSHYLIVLK